MAGLTTFYVLFFIHLGTRRMIIFGEPMLRHLVKEYIDHYHAERNHQGISNAIPLPDGRLTNEGRVTKTERLGGLLNYYHREAA